MDPLTSASTMSGRGFSRRRRRSRRHPLAARPEPHPQRPAQIQVPVAAGPETHHPPAGRFPSGIPDQAADLAQFVLVKVREVPVLEGLAVAPGAPGERMVRLLIRAGIRTRGDRPEGRLPDRGALLPEHHPGKPGAGPAFGRRLPEEREGRVEEFEVFAPVDEERPRGGMELLAPEHLDQRERLCQVEHPGRRDREPDPPQQAAEEREVLE